jgi:predicted DCC family thiol-disulfide oxidoreductase YuxK
MTDGKFWNPESVTPATRIIFDGDCVLCNGMVHFVLRHEKAPTLQFVNAWSQIGLAVAAKHGLSKADLHETYLVVENGQAYTKSDAGLVVLRHLRPPWSWLTVMKIVPRPLRDGVYTLIARRRYRWFGHKIQCFVPPPGTADRFIDR